MIDVQFHFFSSYENFMCYLSAFEPFTAGAELFLSGILREQAPDVPTIKEWTSWAKDVKIYDIQMDFDKILKKSQPWQ